MSEAMTVRDGTLGARPRGRGPAVVLLSGALYLLTTAVLLLISAFYVYATLDHTMNPEKVRPGDISFGDGSGLIIAAFFLLPALPIGAVGVVLLGRWRRGATPADATAATWAVAALIAVACVAALMVNAAQM
jgi:hypothetical protein